MWTYNYDYSDYLMHFGIKGMHWGIRRYQNPDGSLTPAGMEKYNSDKKLNKKIDKKLNKISKKNTNHSEYDLYDDEHYKEYKVAKYVQKLSKMSKKTDARLFGFDDDATKEVLDNYKKLKEDISKAYKKALINNDKKQIKKLIDDSYQLAYALRYMEEEF